MRLEGAPDANGHDDVRSQLKSVTVTNEPIGLTLKTKALFNPKVDTLAKTNDRPFGVESLHDAGTRVAKESCEAAGTATAELSEMNTQSSLRATAAPPLGAAPMAVSTPSPTSSKKSRTELW